MSKKNGKNAFWYFMTDWKARQESQGRSFPNGYRDVQADPDCNAEWRSLSDQQKIPYTNRAKQGKLHAAKGKQTSLGESVQKIKEIEQQALDFKLNMDAHIRHTVFTAKKYDAVPTLKFIFIHMNWYYMREPDFGPTDYCPAEFAIAEFSLGEGITEYYHEIIKTSLHLGYTREAMETSEKTHKLHWNLSIGESDWRKMYEKMINFLEPRMTNGDYPPMYTSKKIIHMIPSLLRRMTDHVDVDLDDFRIYSVEALFSNVLRASNDHSDSNVLGVIAETEFNKELFAYTPDIECDYHRTTDGAGRFCSLSVVRQWAFTICDHCCGPLKIKSIKGVHCPDEPKFGNWGNYDRSGSTFSLDGDCTTSVLSATGVSEAHRIRVSERTRDERRRRRDSDGHLEIIDHSKLKREEHKLEPKTETEYVAVRAPIVARPLRGPTTASQALMGVSREAPLFDGTNFPVIGGRGMRIKTEDCSKPPGSVWGHRGRANSDSD